MSIFASMKRSILNDFSLQTTDFSSIGNLDDVAFVNEHFGMGLNVGATTS